MPLVVVLDKEPQTRDIRIRSATRDAHTDVLG